MGGESEEYKRWEARYSAPDYIFGKEPNYFLAKCTQRVAIIRYGLPGSAVACSTN